MTSLSNTYSNLISGYCRENARGKLILIYLLKLINNYYRVSKKARKIICINQLYHMLCHQQRYIIRKYFTISNWNKYIFFKFITKNSIKLIIKIIPSQLKNDVSYQTKGGEALKFNLNLNLFQLPYGYPTNGARLHIKTSIESDHINNIHLLQIHLFDRHLSHLGHISIKLRGKDINLGALYLEWESTQREEAQDESEEYKGGYLKIDTNPPCLDTSENIVNWKW